MLLLRRMLKNKLLNWNLLRNKYKELFLLIIIFINVILVYSATFTTITQGDFDNGSYNNTYYNTTHNFTQINITSFYSGNYTSKIFNAGSTSQGNNISWVSNAIGELPSNQLVESSFGNGNANMTGNVLLMHMNEASGTIVDSSGQGNKGTSSGVVYSATGKLNTAICSDANTDSITVTDSALLEPGSNPFTVSSWVNSTAFTQQYIVFYDMYGSGKGYHIGFVKSGSNYFPYFYVNSGNPYITNSGGDCASSPLSSTEITNWNNVIVTYIPSTSVDIYINGILNIHCTTDVAASVTSQVRDLKLFGGWYVAEGYTQIGCMDELSVWNRSLSASEVLDLYDRGATRLNLTVRSCDDSACSGEDFAGTYNTSASNLSITNNSFFQYRAFFETDNLSVTPELYNVSVDYTVLDATPPNVNLNLPVNNTNISSTTYVFNFTGVDSISTSLNCSLMVSGTIKDSNSSVINGTLTNLQASSLSIGRHLWNITCNDGASNTNVSVTRLVTIDTNAPSVNTLTLNPGVLDGIDPNYRINVTSNVTDALVNVDSVVFQWKYSNDTLYRNITAWYNTSSKLYENISFLPNANGTINYTVFANDTLGNGINTNVTNINVEFDYTWNITNTNLGEVFGQFNTVTHIGNVTINNTGDYNLSITLSSNFESTTYNRTIPFNVTANSSESVYVNATAAGVQRSDSIVITANATSLDNSNANITPSISTVNATLSAIPPGPYIDLTLDESTSTVTQSNSYNYKVYAKNVGNDTVYNLSLNWSLPTGFSLSSGNFSVNTSSLTVNSKLYNNITIIVQTITPYDLNGTNTNINASGKSAANNDSITLNLSVLCNGAD